MRLSFENYRISLSIYSKALRIIELLLEKTERKIWTTFYLQMDLDSPARHVIKIMEDWSETLTFILPPVHPSQWRDGVCKRLVHVR